MNAIATETESYEDYLNNDYGWKSWLFTTDHKRIGLLYLVSITLFFFLGGLFALIIRLDLMTPPGELVSSETYNKMFSMHGIIMVFFFLIPSIPTVLGNFFLPMMIGARDVAFPRLNLLSWYLFNLGGLCMLYAVVNGGVDTGWTFYPPYSSNFSNTNVAMAVTAIFIAGFSFDPDGAELRHHHQYDARRRNDLVPIAALHLVALRDEPDPGPGHARSGDHAGAGGGRAAAPSGRLRSGVRR